MHADELEVLKKSVPIHLLAAQKLKLEQRAHEFWSKCPFHKEDTPSFSMYRTKDGAWMYKCFGCSATGNIFQLAQQLFQVDFKESVQIVQKMTTDPEWTAKRNRADAVFQPTVQAPKEIISMPVEAFESYVQELGKNESGRMWLQNRGITLDTAELFSLGFVQRPLSQIVPTSHPFYDSGWILFPEIRDRRIVAVKYRSIAGKKGPNGESCFAQRKGMLKSPLYNQSAITPFEDLFIVEGELDCLTMEQAGFLTVSLPSAGYNPSADQRAALMGSGARYLAGDTDEAGTLCMAKLHKELGGDNPKSKTYWLQWPKPYKDANQFFLEACGGNIGEFRARIAQLMENARSRKMPGIHDLKTIAKTANFKPTHDNPARLSFPWPKIDKWVDILPGEVMFAFATETKMGKSTWLMNILMHNVRNGKKVINFSAELSPERYAQMVTAYLTRRNRNTLTEADFQKAANAIPEESFYIGYKPGANFKDAIKLLEDAKSAYGGDIFVVDPLHFLIRGEGNNENALFAAAMRGLVDFAIKWQVVVIAIGQARKAAAGNKGKMAVGQDARHSAALSEDAATTWILHRDRVKTTNDGEDSEPIFSPITHVKLEYSRNSDPMSTRLLFNGPLAIFDEYNNQQIQQEEQSERSFNYGGANGN